MRVYLPATLSDLDAEVLEPTRLHAVTPALRAELPEDDDEMLELVAFLAAADDSVRLLGERGDQERRKLRVVIAADVPAGTFEAGSDDDIETVLVPTAPVPWDLVAAVHVDEAEAAGEVAAAAAGDESAFDRLGERDLLWYDSTEIDALRENLRE